MKWIQAFRHGCGRTWRARRRLPQPGRPCPAGRRYYQPPKPVPIPMVELPRLKEKTGAYVLLIELTSERRIRIGKRGGVLFPAGWYTYTGSACGPGGLAARIRHHLRKTPHPHWHVDYLKPWGRVAGIWYGAGIYHDEHRWASILRAMPGGRVVAPGFGSSDCSCETHLVHFPTRPDIARFRQRQQKAIGFRRPAVYGLSIEGA